MGKNVIYFSYIVLVYKQKQNQEKCYKFSKNYPDLDKIATWWVDSIYPKFILRLENFRFKLVWFGVEV